MQSNRYYRLAIKVAKTSKHKKQKMCAVIVRGGCILSIATNSPSHLCGTFMFGRHAEARAIQRGVDYTGSTIYIARKNAGMSRPCNRCMRYIVESGITKIIYADWNGNLKEEKV